MTPLLIALLRGRVAAGAESGTHPVHPERSGEAAESKGQSSPDLLMDARISESPSGHPVDSEGSTPAAPTLTLNGTAARDEAQALAADAARHGLSALVLHLAGETGLERPASALARLRADARISAAQAMRARALLIRALDALADRGVLAAPLKGHFLAQRLYPDPLLRPSGDVDLLVAREDLERALRALSSLGLAPPSPELERYRREHHHHLELTSPAGTVELHFEAITGFGTQISGAPLLARARPATLEGRRLLALDPADELVYLAVHASQHVFARLSWLYDLKLHLRAHPPDADAVIAAARAHRVEAPAFFALAVAAQALEADVPPAVLDALRPGLGRAGLLRAFTPEALADARWSAKWPGYLATTLFSTGPREMVAYALHHTWHATRRAVAFRFPKLTPEHWRG